MYGDRLIGSIIFWSEGLHELVIDPRVPRGQRLETCPTTGRRPLRDVDETLENLDREDRRDSFSEIISDTLEARGSGNHFRHRNLSPRIAQASLGFRSRQ